MRVSLHYALLMPSLVAVLLIVPSGDALAGEAATRSRATGAKAWVRAAVVRDEDVAHFGLDLDPAWQRCDAGRDVVVMVHGYNSKSCHHEHLLERFRAEKLPVGTFHYPNDDSVDRSARLLSRDLKAFAGRHPDRRVALVTHSLGGLVARAVIEDAELDPGNVRRLVMIAPPSRGTLVARFSYGTDLCEHFFTRGGGSPWRRLRASLADGTGEAKRDLAPGSEFLDELNARPRNPDVAYTIFLGTGAPAYEWEVGVARKGVRGFGRIPGLKEKARRLDATLADMDEVLAGKGDGVVALKRGFLPGVKDTVVFPFTHQGVTGPPEDQEGVAEVHDAVVERLARDVNRN